MSSFIGFGQQVSYSSKMVRVREQKWDRGVKTYWRAWRSVSLPEPSSGIYLGKRVLQNGVLVYDYDEGTHLIPEEYVTVALVSPGPRNNPIYVSLDSLIAEYY